MYFKYAAVRDVTLPKRANPGDAGIDLYIPNDFKTVELEAGDSVLIPSGIKFEVPYGFMVLFLNKSGVAVKKNLHVGAQVIDHGYSGEVHINLTNVGVTPQVLKAGDKIIQAVVVPVVLPELVQVVDNELYSAVHVASARGAGGFGSTGDK